MANETFTLKKMLENFRDDNGEMLSGPSKTLWRDTIYGLITAANLIPNPLDFKKSVLALEFTFDVPNLPDFPSPFPPDLTVTPGGDPIEPLRAIASAIGSAENILNDDNLVIAQAAVEVNMSVNVTGLAGANTTIKFGIEPRSM